MKANGLIKLISITFLFIAASSMGIDLQAQTRRSPPVERVEYTDVRDTFFPRYIAGVSNGWGLGIWYRPCQGKELQLTMRETSEKEKEVILYSPVKDSLREQFKAYMKRHPNARFEQVAPAMKVKERVIPLSTEESRSLRQEILDVMERSIRFEKDFWPVPGRTHTMCLHCECIADSYTISFEGVSGITLSSAMSEYASGAEPPFVTWMKEKRPQFEKWAESK